MKKFWRGRSSRTSLTCFKLYTHNDLSEPPQYEKPEIIRIEGVPYHLSNIVSLPFFLVSYLTHHVPRGPFKSSREWLVARLPFYNYDSDRVPADADKYDLGYAECIEVNATRLLVLQTYSPTPMRSSFCTTIILISRIFSVPTVISLGIIDWDCIYTAPLWFAYQLPEFLHSRDCHEHPIGARYMYREVTMEEENINITGWIEEMEERKEVRRPKDAFRRENSLYSETTRVFLKPVSGLPTLSGK